MLPGVDLTCLPKLMKGTLCSVCVPGNPAPVAVSYVFNLRITPFAMTAEELYSCNLYGECSLGTCRDKLLEHPVCTFKEFVISQKRWGVPA